MRYGRCAALLGAATSLVLCAPAPASLITTLTAPPAADPTAPVVAVLALLAELLTAYLLTVVVLIAGSRVGGTVGTAGDALLCRVAPFAVRRAVAVLLGAGLLVGVAGPGTASASEDLGSQPGAALDWPALQPAPQTAAPSPTVGPEPETSVNPATAVPAPSVATTAPARPGASPVTRARPAPRTPALDWPTPAEPSAPDPAAVTRPAAAGAVVTVEAGDTLWALAREGLRAGATDPEVAAAWPAWWSANREVVGDDPHLLRPGQQLRPPR